MSGIEEQKVVSVPNFGTEEKQNMKKRKKMTFYRVLQEITDKRNVEGEIVVVDPKCGAKRSYLKRVGTALH